EQEPDPDAGAAREPHPPRRPAVEIRRRAWQAALSELEPGLDRQPSQDRGVEHDAHSATVPVVLDWCGLMTVSRPVGGILSVRRCRRGGALATTAPRTD